MRNDKGKESEALTPEGQQLLFEQPVKNTLPEQTPRLRTTRNVIAQMEQGYGASRRPSAGIQLSLFNELPDSTQKRIKEKNADISSLYIGADLDGAGWRMIEVLQKLLYLHSSNTSSQNSEDYYMGCCDYEPQNEEEKALLLPIDIPVVGGEVVAHRPIIVTSVTELAAEYSCTNRPSNKAIESAKETLIRNASKNYLLCYTEYYTEQYTDKNGNIKERKKSREIKSFCPLYKVLEVTEKDENGKPISRQLIIVLNPIFQRQIATHYNLKPLDFLDRVTNASKPIWTRQLPDALLPFLNKLIDAQHNQGHYNVPEKTYNVRQTALYEMIAPKEVKKRDNKGAAEKLAGFIKVATDIGLLEKHWTETSKENGEIVHYFQVVGANMWN